MTVRFDICVNLLSRDYLNVVLLHNAGGTCEREKWETEDLEDEGLLGRHEERICFRENGLQIADQLQIDRLTNLHEWIDSHQSQYEGLLK